MVMLGAHVRLARTWRMVRDLSHLPETRNAYRGRPRIRPGAPARLTLRRARAPGGTLAAALVCAALGGCAGGLQSVYTTDIWVEPGKYEFLKCPDLARRSVDLSDAEKKLVSQMERAHQRTDGNPRNYSSQRLVWGLALTLRRRLVRDAKGMPASYESRAKYS